MEKVPFQLDTKEQSYQSLHKLFVYDVRQNLQFIFLSWYFNGINPREFSLDSQNLILAKKKNYFPSISTLDIPPGILVHLLYF